MSGNRFDFLEIGETVLPAAPTVPAPRDRPPAGAAEPRVEITGEPSLDGTALAEVRITDPRGYAAFLEQVPPVETSALRLPPGTLRVVEVFGERGAQAGQFNFPTGLAVDKRGILFVADSYNHRIQRITPNGGVAVIGGRGSGKGQFLSPQAVATDDWQAFYIAEQGNHRVQKYSAEGVLELMFGRPGHREGELQGPTAIAVAPGTGDIFVADTGNCRIQRFDCEGRFLGLIGGPGGISPPLTSPQALAVDAADNLYVADTFAQRIIRYDPLGRFSGEYGGRFGVAGLPGAPVSQFHEPRALACDFRGALYVADSAAETTGGGMVTHGRIQALEAGTGAVRATVNAPGRGLGSLVRPSGLAVGPPRDASSGRVALGDLYISDTMNHRILRFVWEENRYG